MNLLDDFLFGSVVTYPEIGERFVKSLLKIIFGREFKHLSVTAQKVLYGADRNLHGARLDVYLEPESGDDSEGRATVYDIEPDRKGTPADKKALPRRVRFYHGKIAARSLNSGADYEELREIHRMVESVKKDPEVAEMRIQIMDDVIRLTEENMRISEESAKKTEQITKLTKETEKMAEEIIRLRKELAQKA